MAQTGQGIAGVEEQYPRYRWVVLGLLMFTQEVCILLTGSIGILLPAMRADLGFGVAESGLLASLGQLPTLVLSVLASLVLVRFSPKRVYFGALILAGLMGFACGQAPAFIFLAVAYCLTGISTVTRQIADTLLKLQWVPKKELASIMGLTMGLMAMGQSVGVIVIPFLLIALDSWRNLFSVYGLTVLVLSIVWIIFARERITPAYQKGMTSAAGRAPLKGVLKRKEFLLLAIPLFGGPLAYMNTFFFLPTFLTEERGMALTTIGFITGLMPIGGICATFVMGFVSDRIGLRKPTIWPAGLILPFMYIALLSPGTPSWALPVLTFAIGFVAWSPFPAFRTIPFELPGLEPSEVAVGQSLMQTSTSLATVLGAPLVGYLAEVFGSMGTALRVLCLFPLTIVAAGLLLPETGPKARHKLEKVA